ncbi:hypothetical protein [Polymorphospora sp. NPDC050346]|uniref:hypothetical protein n=1 Tax=Polymorphospora sp. NPDC050346 TaxID=3155780 RepID=UPI003408A6ED
MRVVNVRCPKPMARELGVGVAAARAAERSWLEERREQVRLRVLDEDLSAAKRRVLLGELNAEFYRLRAAGVLVGTRTAFVLPALRSVLQTKGWTVRRWRPVPRQPAGRPWGTHDQGFDARVALHLPDDVAELLVRACYWVSKPAVDKLQAWYDLHGDHWRGRLHDPDARWIGAGPSHSDLSERDRLAAQVVTTGMVLREAIRASLEVNKVET